MVDGNERISLWILEQERQRDKENMLKEIARKSRADDSEEKNQCRKCQKKFAKAKLVQYYACPHCLNKIEGELETGCRQWLGFLSQKGSGEPVPQECVECSKVLECMLSQCNSSPTAVLQIKKWY